ncbi:MAG: hypothetical protein ABI986_10190 [Chloroflexota bacterium]
MTDPAALPKIIDELLIYLFDGQSHPLFVTMTNWLASSRRFTIFINTFRDKLRKKLRTIPDQERLLDLQFELETAYLLLQERSLSVVYEPQLGQVRYPDFAVTFTTSLTFMVEVTRLQSQVRETPTAPALTERLIDTMCDKLGQLLTQRSNILLVGVEAPYPTQSDIQAALLRVQQRVERNDSMFLQQHGFRDRADFFQYFQRLSEILIRDSRLQASESVVIWVNPQAKYPLPGKVRTVLYRSHKA